MVPACARHRPPEAGLPFLDVCASTLAYIRSPERTGLQGCFAIERRRKIVAPARIDLTLDKLDRERRPVSELAGNGYRFTSKIGVVNNLPDKPPFRCRFRIKRLSKQRQSPRARSADGSLH